MVEQPGFRSSEHYQHYQALLDSISRYTILVTYICICIILRELNNQFLNGRGESEPGSVPKE